MKINKLSIPGCLVFEPEIYGDSRGSFHEWFKFSSLTESIGQGFNVKQANSSISKKGVVRGIHFAGYPPGQAKYVTCVSGSAFDVIVDFRIGSPTFGRWESIQLDPVTSKILYIPNGIGHSFMALNDDTKIIYLCDQEYNPNNEFTVNPFDKSIGILWPKGIQPILSEKDENGSKFEELFEIYSKFESK